MTTSSVCKVIAAGMTADGRLRATVSIAPAGPGLAGRLPKWPSSVVNDLRAGDWKIRLRVGLVRLRPESTCRQKSYQDVVDASRASDAFTVFGRAEPASNSWNERGFPRWVDELWIQSIENRSCNGDAAVWDILASSLEQSNSGTAFSRAATPSSAPAREDEWKKYPPANSAAPVKKEVPIRIGSIVPSLQSDLSVLLEMERALELCSTARWAHADSVAACSAEETHCAEIARNALVRSSNDPSNYSLGDLWDTCNSKIESAKVAMSNEYKSLCSFSDQPPEAPWGLDPKSVARLGRAGVSARTGGRIDSQEVSSRPDPKSSTPTDEEYAKKAAKDPEQVVNQAFYAIQSSPAMSRLFGLTFDVYVKVEDLMNALHLTGTMTDPQACAYMLISVDDISFPVPAGGKNVWTLAKYRPAVLNPDSMPPGTESASPHFFPASRIELGMGDESVAHAALTQFDGLMMVGQKLALPKHEDGTTPTVPRFMLSSLDVRAACDAVIDRRYGPEPSDPAADALLARRPPSWARKTFPTAGLAVLDRGRQGQAAMQFASRGVHLEQSEWILDADDLLIGYRLDVAVPVAMRPKSGPGSATLVWRSLMARDVSHGPEGEFGERVRASVRALMGYSAKTGAAWQKTLDDLVLSLPARLVFSSADDKGAQADAFVDETIALWTGDPMGAHCPGPPTSKTVEHSIGAGQKVSLPSRGSKPSRCPPSLRFGWPYRVGLRAVLSGAISLPMSVAQTYYNRSSLSHALTLPASTVRSDGKTVSHAMHRFLRHERIDAPFVLMHEDIALRRLGSMGYERSDHVIVRSVKRDIGENERERPVSTQRIFVPPSVDVHFAALHGVFDDDGSDHPADGLRGVRYDASGGGFPFVTARSIVGINEETFSGPRIISTSKGQRGDLVYARGGTSRAVPYFPDPAARQYVIGVRYAGTDAYLEGGPFTRAIFKNPKDYPNARPLVLTIERDTAAPNRSSCPRLEQVLKDTQGRTAGLPVVREGVGVTLTLAPGDDFEVDVWCIPDVETLTRTFALVESVGVAALARAENVSVDGFWTALGGLLPAPMCTIVRDQLCGKDGSISLDLKDIESGNQGIGGLKAPRGRALRAIALSLYETLTTRAMDEISAVRSIRATHATLRPALDPSFQDEGHRRFSLRRITAALGQPASASAAGDEPRAVGDPAGETMAQGEYMIVGDLHIDLPTTGGFELTASTAFPTISTFDDPFRGRTRRDKRNGTWPAGTREFTNREVFGFDVDCDGRVSLPRAEFTLLRVDSLAAPMPLGLQADETRTWRLPLESVSAASGGSNLGVMKARHIFPDQKARQLEVRVRAYTRHESLMRTASSVARDGHWLRSGRAVLPHENPDRKAVVWLNAGIRPSEPSARTPIPAFRMSKDGTSRSTVVRIPLGRGWFSSGEDEKLGIVVWPPNLFDAEMLAGGGSKMNLPSAGNRAVDLDDFVDEDLGPGGKFITRWGGDPLRPPPETFDASDAFLTKAAFPDLDNAAYQWHTPRVVANVQMPLRIAGGKRNAGGTPQRVRFLGVSLLTFEPRFDIQTEEWYVDVAIAHPSEAHPFVRLGLVRYQEHAAPDLQVSYPAIQWAQLMPRRDVRLESVIRGTSSASAVIVVEGIGDELLRQTTLRAGEAIRAPRMSLRVVREYTSESGTVCRQHVLEKPVEMLPELNTPTSLKARWTATAVVEAINKAVDQDQAAHYFAYIEERQSFLPATYPVEPISALEANKAGSDSTHLLEEGPRFATRIRLPF